MDDSSKWISCFNTKLEEFLKDLILTYPDDKDFVMFKQSFNLLKLVDDRKPVQMFAVYAPKYREQILKQDETFFLYHDFKEEFDNINDSNLSLNILIKLKNYWSQMNSENKGIIWKYLNILFKLNDKICI
jgi:hypothetical protein